MQAKYVNPFTDFGFKKIFGEEASQPLLLDFLKSLLPESNLASLSFKDKEQLGKWKDDRKAIFDIYCENIYGEKIIIELQKAKQNYFKDRTVYYASFPIQEQAERGDWNYSLKSVYCVGILDFKFDEDKFDQGEVIHTVKLKDQNNQIFYDKLTFRYLEMPHFHKKESELDSRLDKWLYFIKHLEDFQSIPDIFRDEIFERAFEKAAIANYSSLERDEYHESLKIYRDYKNTIDTAFDDGKALGLIEGKKEGIKEGIKEGKKEGIIESKKELATKAFEMGLDIETIQKLTGLTFEEISNLIK